MITIDSPSLISEGVKWAVKELPEIKKDLRLTVKKTGLKEYGEEGFSIKIKKNILTVTANTDVGLIYGLLELKNRLLSPKEIKQINFQDKPIWKIRLWMEAFPFQLGIKRYSTVFYGDDHSEKNWWYSHSFWIKRFQEAASRRINGIVYMHPHPFPVLIEYEKYSEATYFSKKETAHNIENFKWIMEKGKQYGVNIYLYFRNIHYPPGFAKKHSLPPRGGVNSPLTQRYTNYCITKLMQTYPKLKGLVTGVGETMPHIGHKKPSPLMQKDTNFIIKNIITPLNDIGVKNNHFPLLIIRTEWISPSCGKQIIRSYKGRGFLASKVNRDEMIYSSRTDKSKADGDNTREYTIKKWSKLSGNTGMIGFWAGWARNLAATFWANPRFIRDFHYDLWQNNGAGIMNSRYGYGNTYSEFGSNIAKKKVNWLCDEAVAKYSWNPIDYDKNYWIRRIKERYGLCKGAKHLLCAMENSSWIIPKVTWVSYDERFDQFGILLWEFDFHRIPALFDKGKRPILSIREYVKNTVKNKKVKVTTPLQIANEIESHADLSLKNLRMVTNKYVNRSKIEFDRLQDYLMLNYYIGNFYSDKIKAAVYLKLSQFSTGKKIKEYGERGLFQLKSSVDWWEKVVLASNRIYSKPIPVEMYCSSKPHWRKALPIFKDELRYEKLAFDYRMGKGKRKLGERFDLWFYLASQPLRSKKERSLFVSIKTKRGKWKNIKPLILTQRGDFVGFGVKEEVHILRNLCSKDYPEKRLSIRFSQEKASSITPTVTGVYIMPASNITNAQAFAIVLKNLRKVEQTSAGFVLRAPLHIKMDKHSFHASSFRYRIPEDSFLEVAIPIWGFS